MSTAAEVATAFGAVFTNSSIKALTNKYYSYDVTQNSERELTDFYYQTEVNFFTYLVTRSQVFAMTKKAEYKFNVEVNYYRYKDPAGANYQAVRSAFDTLFSAVRSDLGQTWTSTVDFWRTQDGPPDISTVNIGNDECYRGKYIFTGSQLITLS